MHLSEFDYYLPPELIAQEPLKRRDQSRLLVLEQKTGQIAHRQFGDLLSYLRSGDVLVSNRTRVIPARLYGQKVKTGAMIEILLVQQLGQSSWEVLVRPGKRVKLGTEIFFGDGELKAKTTAITVSGSRIMKFDYEGIFWEVLERLGQTPLPPYIKKKLLDPGRYQTIYACEPGSSAAPTAGLHFTPTLLRTLQARGIEWVEILLHVGLGTFRPVKEEQIEKHQMHKEYFSVSSPAAEKINQAIREKRRIIGVGTTSARTLESVGENGFVQARDGWTEIFIYPGYQFKIVSGLLTNFHLPKSTLLMLVSALAGQEKIKQAYAAAIQEKYRFFSFGDAMLII